MIVEAMKKSELPRLLRFRLRVRRWLSRPRYELLGEDVFRRILCCERKRAERSGRMFLLMLAHVEEVLQANKRDRTMSAIASALSCATRETDISGWYWEGVALGVIFTELGDGNWEAMKEFARRKVKTALRAKLAPDEVDRIHFSLHLFPDSWDKNRENGLANATLYPDLLEQDEARKLSRMVKRAIDIVGSIAALMFCFPLLVIIALAIKLSSKGPVLFKQERVGRHGSRFTFLKFRTMVRENDASIHREYVKRFISGQVNPAGHDAGQDAVYKIQDDPRVTRVGKFLRKSSLDELPQLINVLKGDMSLVGPRPPIPYEFEAYQIWHRRRLQEAQPGITGLWQVNGRSRIKFDDMVRLDLRYARSWSLWLDIKILWQTPRAVLFGAGAY